VHVPVLGWGWGLVLVCAGFGGHSLREPSPAGSKDSARARRPTDGTGAPAPTRAQGGAAQGRGGVDRHHLRHHRGAQARPGDHREGPQRSGGALPDQGGFGFGLGVWGARLGGVGVGVGIVCWSECANVAPCCVVLSSVKKWCPLFSTPYDMAALLQLRLRHTPPRTPTLCQQPPRNYNPHFNPRPPPSPPPKPHRTAPRTRRPASAPSAACARPTTTASRARAAPPSSTALRRSGR